MCKAQMFNIGPEEIRGISVVVKFHQGVIRKKCPRELLTRAKRQLITPDLWAENILETSQSTLAGHLCTPWIC